MTDENTTTKAHENVSEETSEEMSQETYEKKYKEHKARRFIFLLYPDSAPKDFIELLSKQELPIAISPLHNLDKVENPEDYTKEYLEEYKGFKKPHYHGIIVANNSVTTSAIRKRLQRALGKNEAVGQVKICDHIKGAYEYLTHESSDAIRKNKHVYSKEDIVHINNFDIARYVTISADERKQNLAILIDLIDEHRLCNVIQLKQFILANPDCGIDWADAFDVTDTRGTTLRMYFDGAYQEERKNQQDHVLRVIGEMHDQVQELWTCTSGLRRAERKARSRSTRQRARAKRVKGARA